MTGLLYDKVSLITGGSIGIGQATAFAFSREGAKVVVADILEEEGEETAQLIRENGGEAIFVRCDVSLKDDVKALIEKTVSEFGRLDCAVNNAGIEGDTAPTADCTEENWDRVVDINMKGVWLCMKYEIRQMLKQESGAIVNMSSVAGVIAERGMCAYAAAKGGVIQLTRTAAVEYAGTGTRINAICPGAIKTAMTDRAMDNLSIDAMAPGAVKSAVGRRMINSVMHTGAAQKMMMSMLQPMGRAGQPEEIAEAAVFLCSDGASFMTGQSMIIDGGMTAA